MKIAYLDCASGISGDMLLGALIDVGVSLSSLSDELKKLNIEGYSIEAYKTRRSGISATKVDVKVHEHTHCRRFKDIESIITNSILPTNIQQQGLAIFTEIFKAETKVHGVDFYEAHLHELSAIDCIIDIIGSVIGLHLLGVEKLYVSDINVGSGTVQTSHGIMSIPAPATMELLKGYRIYSSQNAHFELTTPTGAAILKGLNAIQSPLPRFAYNNVGYGAGNKDPNGFINALRIIIAEGIERVDKDTQMAVVIQTNIDDMNPQIYPVVIDKLFAIGAYDVWMQSIMMKKGRPGIKLSVIAAEPTIDSILDILFNETTTIGVRIHKVDRVILQRQKDYVTLPEGTVQVKKCLFKDKVVNIHPEFEDIQRLSKETNRPIKKIANKFYE